MKSNIFKIASIVFLLISSNLIAQTAYKLGDVVTDFSLKNIEDKLISLSNYPNTNGLLIVFYNHQCPLSLAYENRINALNAKYSSKGYPILAINPNSTTLKTENTFDSMTAYAKNKTFTFPYLFDENQEITAAFGAKSTPQVYLLQNTKKGFVLVYTGIIDNDLEDINSDNSIKYIENAVDQLIAGKKIAVNQTNFIGCPVNFKTPAQ